MSEVLGLLRGLAEKEYILLKEYPIETIGGIAGMYIIFLTVFFGGSAVAGGQFGDAIGAVVVGFFLLMLATTSFQGVSDVFTKEAQWGTLERLVLSPLGFGRVTIAIAVVNVGVSFVWGISILILMLATTDVQLSFNVLSVVPILVFSIATTLGLGLFASGATVLYKRVGTMFRLFGLVFVGFVAAPVQSYPVLKLLPLAQGSYLLRRVMTDGVTLMELPPTEVAILVGVGIAYPLLGYFGFRWFVVRAKEKGVLGHY